MARNILEKNPYDKKVLLTDAECTMLLSDDTPCSYCNTIDKNKNHENVGQVRWREPYARGNAFPLCRLCFKVRRGRSFNELCAYAVNVLAHLNRAHGGTSTDILLDAARRIQRAVCSARRNNSSTSHGSTVIGNNDQPDRENSAQLAQLRQRYAAYVGRQNMRPPDNSTGRRSCAWGELGEPRRQGGATEENRRLTYRCFRALMHVRACFYCGASLQPCSSHGGSAANTNARRRLAGRLVHDEPDNFIQDRGNYTSTGLHATGSRRQGNRVATLDRISSSACYSPLNVVVVCGICNQTKSRLEMGEFVCHLKKLETEYMRARKES